MSSKPNAGNAIDSHLAYAGMVSHGVVSHAYLRENLGAYPQREVLHALRDRVQSGVLETVHTDRGLAYRFPEQRQAIL